MVTGLLIALVDFILFNKNIKTLSAIERKKLVTAGPYTHGLIGVLLIGVMFFVHKKSILIVLILALSIHTLWATFDNQKKLKQLGFDIKYLDQSIRISFLAILGTALLLAGFFINV
jgi:hypothetical protein